MEDDGKALRVTVVHPSGRRGFDPVSKARLIERCLQPGASVARLALAHGVNANLLWKWIRQHRQSRKGPLPSSSTSAFIPVVTADRSVPMQSVSTGLAATHDEERLAKSERTGHLPSPAKVSASLPNGVKLTLECGDVDALTAIIGALGHVQTGR